MSAEMRSVTLLLAILAAVASCSLMQPAGTRPLVVQMQNTGTIPLVLAIETPRGVIEGSAQPASIGAGASQRVTLFVPPSDDWWLSVGESPMFSASDFLDMLPGCQTISLAVSDDGGGSLGCSE
jgi:hypothetical protein